MIIIYMGEPYLDPLIIAEIIKNMIYISIIYVYPIYTYTIILYINIS